MYELDHMLNGNGSRQHLQQRIRQAQQEKFAGKVEAAHRKDTTVSAVRALLLVVLHMIWR